MVFKLSLQGNPAATRGGQTTGSYFIKFLIYTRQNKILLLFSGKNKKIRKKLRSSK
jgi:hypothetical protein